MAKLDTSNPFNEGVTYEAFLKNITGKATVKSFLSKGKYSKEQIDWIVEEIKHFKNNK